MGIVGVVTGLVGVAGGVGGFVLPNVLGLAKQITGSFAPGIVAFALVARWAAFNVFGRFALVGDSA